MKRKLELRLEAEKYDIDKMIAECERIKKDNEVITFGIGVGRMLPKIGMIKKQEKALDYIKSLDGFLGVHPIDLWHNILLFDSLNNAKAAKNLLTSKGISVGTYVVPGLILKEYLKNE